MDGSEVNVVAGSWNWRSAVNMVGCRRVSVIDVFGDWRPGSLPSLQEARRRISQQYQMRPLENSASKSNATIAALA